MTEINAMGYLDDSYKNGYRKGLAEGQLLARVVSCDPEVLCACKSNERAAIVAWLRSVGGTLNVWADQIERGEHLRDDNE